MLDLMPYSSRDCSGPNRRHLLQIGALAGLGCTLPDWVRAKEAGRGRDVNCILVWTQGGTSHHDTFDPKPNAAVDIRGEFNAIPTAVPGVQFSEAIPNFARELKRFAVLRSWNPRNGSHGIADQYVMSGHPFNPAVHYPTFGATVSSLKGFRSQLPPFVQLGSSIDRRFGGGASGYLGLPHMPFEMSNDPNVSPFVVRDITPPKGVGYDRVERRRTMLQTLDAIQRGAEAQAEAFEALDRHYQAALNMVLSPETKRAFDIDQEDAKTRDAYGRTKFGQSCLLARRLIESGVRFVTVTDGGWDTHANNFKSLRERLLPPVDKGLPALLTDLEERGMLDNTLVLWLTDFGRTPKVNSASGRDHWASSGFALMAGAGTPGGSVLGRTDDEGGRALDHEYLSEDIAATVYTKLGIPPDTMTEAKDGRPLRLNEGRLIREWM